MDSVHEKNVRHGHISTLHIWPARRPLAACRAALIATLLPDPSAEPKPAGMSVDAWHEEIIRRGGLFYSMEEATIFTWCSTHGNVPVGAIDTVYAQRTVSPTVKAFDDAPATKVALRALVNFKI